MSITRSYNRKLNRTYVYETTYEWSEERQRRIQKRKCIGQVDPDTGETIPNGKVGRRPLTAEEKRQSGPNKPGLSQKEEISIRQELKRLKAGLKANTEFMKSMEVLLSRMAQETSHLREALDKALDSQARR